MKLCLIGDQAVGKTSLAHRFIKRSFPTVYKATIGVDVLSRTIDLLDQRVEISLWDFSGQSLFSRVRSTFYRAAVGIIVVFDVANENSFSNIQAWWDEARKNVESETPPEAILLGNKSDLITLREVDDYTAHELGVKNGLKYYPVSAKTGDKVELAILELIQKILKKRNIQKASKESPKEE